MATNTERAVDEQSKFQFYFVALIFTLLGASVQSVSIESYERFEFFLETSGWLSLLLAGFLLLAVLERRSHLFSIHGHLDKDRRHLQLTGEQIGELESMASSFRTSISRRYVIGRWLFVIGMALVVGARVSYGYRLAFA